MTPTLSCLLADLPPALADALAAEFDRLTAERDEARRTIAAMAEDAAMLRAMVQAKEMEAQAVRVLLLNSQQQAERYRACLEHAELTRVQMLWGLYLPTREGRA